VGDIPSDWNIVHLGDVGKFKNGINKSSEAFGHGFPFVNLMDVFGVSSISSSDALDLVDTNNAEQQSYDLRRGDVIFIRSSVKPSGVGLTAVVEKDLPKTVFSGFLIRFRDNDVLSDGFKRHCFFEEGFRRRLIGTSSVSANTNINQGNLKRLLIALPPSKNEQEAIAKALSDADALIESVEKFLAKMHNVKQGAMQELLTGRTRLPGFMRSRGSRQTEAGVLPDDWEVSTVGTEFSIQLGKMLDVEKNVGVTRSFVGNRSVQWGRIDTTDIGEIKLTPSDLQRYRLREGDLLVCEGGEVGRAAIWHRNLEECYYQKALHRLRSKRGYNVELMLNQLRRLSSSGYLMNFVTQTSIAHLPKDKFETVPIPVPPTQEEQNAIATVLRDMDQEIGALEAKLRKIRNLKQGMMQELLTGRIRVV
jgi:type I restriction enzyme S subunit